MPAYPANRNGRRRDPAGAKAVAGTQEYSVRLRWDDSDADIGEWHGFGEDARQWYKVFNPDIAGWGTGHGYQVIDMLAPGKPKPAFGSLGMAKSAAEHEYGHAMWSRPNGRRRAGAASSTKLQWKQTPTGNWAGYDATGERKFTIEEDDVGGGMPFILSTFPGRQAVCRYPSVNEAKRQAEPMVGGASAPVCAACVYGPGITGSYRVHTCLRNGRRRASSTPVASTPSPVEWEEGPAGRWWWVLEGKERRATIHKIGDEYGLTWSTAYPKRSSHRSLDEAKRVAEEWLMHPQIRNARRRVPSATKNDPFVEGFASTIWGMSWASHVDEHRCTNLSGTEITEVMPEIPDRAYRLAEEFIEKTEKLNHKTMREILLDAARADGDEDLAEDDDYAKSFGSDLGFMVAESGVSWFDDHEDFPLKVPRGDTYELQDLADELCEEEGRPRAPCGHYCDARARKCGECGQPTGF